MTIPKVIFLTHGCGWESPSCSEGSEEVPKIAMGSVHIVVQLCGLSNTGRLVEVGGHGPPAGLRKWLTGRPKTGKRDFQPVFVSDCCSRAVAQITRFGPPKDWTGGGGETGENKDTKVFACPLVSVCVYTSQARTSVLPTHRHGQRRGQGQRRKT